jgi:hypothetical protein
VAEIDWIISSITSLESDSTKSLRVLVTKEQEEVKEKLQYLMYFPPSGSDSDLFLAKS